MASSGLPLRHVLVLVEGLSVAQSDGSSTSSYASCRGGITALTRADLDLDAGTVRVRLAYVERSTVTTTARPP